VSESAIDVELNVRNTGSRDGEEVVQLYVQHLHSKVPRAERALKAFQRVAIPAGESRAVKLRVAAQDLAYWDEAAGRFVVEADTIRVLVGSSAGDTRLTALVRTRRPGWSPLPQSSQ
jgi:beta-glucosidase